MPGNQDGSAIKHRDASLRPAVRHDGAGGLKTTKRPPFPGVAGAQTIPLNEFDQLGKVFSEWKGQIDQVSCGRFEGKLRIAHGEQVCVVAAEFSQRIAIRGRNNAGLLAIYPVTKHGSKRWQGREVQPGQLIFQGVEVETEECSPKRRTTTRVFFHPESLAKAVRTGTNANRIRMPRTWALYTPDPQAFADLNRQLDRLLETSLSHPSLLGTTEGRQLEEDCLQAVVAALMSPSVPEAKLPLPERARLVRRAEVFFRSQLSAPLAMTDLCRDLNANDRTLRLAFREWYGIGPMTYFRFLRLNAVRDLLRSDASVSIADAAHTFGYQHLGNFAAEYRRLFGERPSETKRPS